jgi:molybdate transport system ATP-binding protein
MLHVEIRRRFPGFSLNVAFTAGDERVVFFGPSGAGKSLTLQCIAGIVRPDAGRIVAGGRVLYDSDAGIRLPPQARNVGYVPQRYALFPHLTVEENIGYGLRSAPRHERRRRVGDLIALMGLGGLERRRPAELSGGQQQRVALARALAREPDTLLLDEPFGALDVGIRSELRDALIALQERRSLTAVVVTHDLADAFLLGQRIVVVDHGRVLQQGTREDVFYRPATRRVAEFVETRNILPAVVRAVEGAVAHLSWNGVALEAETPSDTRLRPGQTVDVCIRPTRIMIKPPEVESYAGRQNVFCGTIVEEIIGAETYRLFVRLAGSQHPCDLEIELPGYVYFRLGLDRTKEIEMSVRRELVHIIPPGPAA